MFYVYRYIDIFDNIIKYIGKVTEQELCQRIRQHSYEEKFQNSDWRIEYIVCKTRTQADAYESHFIAKYKTYRFLNVAKANWGIMPELEGVHFKWISYYDVQYSNSKNFYGSIVLLSQLVNECSKKNSIVMCYLASDLFGNETLDTYLSMISLYISAQDGYSIKNEFDYNEPDYDSYLYNKANITFEYCTNHCADNYYILHFLDGGKLVLCCSENSKQFLTNINDQYYRYYPRKVYIFE